MGARTKPIGRRYFKGTDERWNQLTWREQSFFSIEEFTVFELGGIHSEEIAELIQVIVDAAIE